MNDEKSCKHPFSMTGNFTQIPNAIFLHYGFYPGFTGNDLRVYVYLLQMYNADYGYAFPSQLQAYRDLGISDKTFRKSVNKLCEMKLIEVATHPQYGNNIYRFIAPIENASDFYATFPQAKAVHDRKLAIIEKIAPKKAESKRRYVEKQTEEDAADLTDWL